MNIFQKLKQYGLVIAMVIMLIGFTSCSGIDENACENRKVNLINQSIIFSNHSSADGISGSMVFLEFDYSGVTYGINIGSIPAKDKTPPGVWQIAERTIFNLKRVFGEKIDIIGSWDCRTKTLHFDYKGYRYFILHVKPSLEPYVCMSNLTIFESGDTFARIPCKDY